MLLANVWLYLSLAWLAACDVSITAPASGKTYSGLLGTVLIDITWEDLGSGYSLSDFTAYTFILMTGSNSNITAIKTIGKSIAASSITGDLYTAEFASLVCADGLFYFQVYAAVSTTEYAISYTNRFTLSGMTGTAEASGSGSPPDGQTTSGGSGSVNSASFSIPYTLQTGRTRYAPMQTQPGSTVTATTWTRQFPTSAVTYYTTMGPKPVVYSTITPGWNYTVSLAMNYATPAPDPLVAGWYNPSLRLLLASLLLASTAHAKRNRWAE